MDEQVVLILIIGTIVLGLLVTFIVGFAIIYRDRQRKFLAEKNDLENIFKQEQLRSGLEIQEQTLDHISQEIHDNIGQVLSLVRLQLNSLPTNPSEEKIQDTDELLGQAIADLRTLSHTLNTTRLKKIGIIEAIRQSLIALEKTGFYATTFSCDSGILIPEEYSIIIYRMFQEILNNIVKHASATAITICIGSANNKTVLKIADNGVGFNIASINESTGIGLKNIQDRGKVINAGLQINSSLQGGTEIIITF